MYETGRYLTVTGHALDAAPDDVRQVRDAIADAHAEHIADPESEREAPKPAGDGGVKAQYPGANPGVGPRKPGPRDATTDLSDDELLDRAMSAENGEKFRRLWDGDTSEYPSHSEADLALCSLLAFYAGPGGADRVDRLFRRSGLMREQWDEDRGGQTYGERTVAKAYDGLTEFYNPGAGAAEPPDPGEHGTPERVEDGLVDALLADPDAWIDADAKVWAIRETEDYDPETIADAIADGELPGDADAALADAVLAGDVPGHIGEALTSWRQDPDAWTAEVARSFGDTDLSPEAIADELHVPVSELREEPNGRLAYAVWERVRQREDIHIVARTGEEADGALFAYDHDAGVWRQTGEDDLRTLGREALGEAYTSGVGRELEEQVRTTNTGGADGQVHIDAFGAPPETVPLADGLLDLTDRSIRPIEPDDYVLATLPVGYDPDAECPSFEEYLTEVCPRSVDRQKLQEYVGYALMHWALPYHKALFIAGPQASGKSTFLDVVHALLGDDATCSLAPQEMTEERFAGYDLWGAWANIRSDIPADLIENTGKFKELVAGDPVKVERKYQDPVAIRPTAKNLFAANTLPSADIDDDAFFRRILMVSFPKTVPRDERDPHLFEDHVDELPGVLNWALDGLDRLREQGHFTADLPPAETQGKWRSWGESIERFKERCIDEDAKATDTVPKRHVFDAYRDFCEAEGIPAESKQKFGREMMNTTGVGDRQKTVDGKRVWCYTGIGLVTDRVPTPDPDSHDEGQQHRFGGFGA
jgi:putative DNA primase/helicase